MAAPYKDISGKRFGRLLVIKRIPENRRGYAVWLCRCDCGNEKKTSYDNLIDGQTQSCGCLGVEQRIRLHKKNRKYKNHSHKNQLEYTSWLQMQYRCYNENAENFEYYGAKGVTVCDRWRFGENGKLGFDCFMEDMGSRPTPQHSLDRYPDKRGNYEPNNTRWATPLQQRHNQEARKPYGPRKRKAA